MTLNEPNSEYTSGPIDRLVGRVSRVLLAVGISILLIITLLLVVNVLLRFVGGNIQGIVELVSYGLLACIMLALPYTHRTAGHIRITLIVSRFGPRFARVFYLAAQAITAIVTLTIAAMYLVNTWALDRYLVSGLLPIPELPFRIAVVIGFGLWGIEAILALGKPDTSVDVDPARDELERTSR